MAQLAMMNFSCLFLWSLVYIVICQYSGPPKLLSLSST